MLSVIADSEGDGLGGVQVTTAGQVSSSGLLFLGGSNLHITGATAAPFDSVDIQDDGANRQVVAAEDISIFSRMADINDSRIDINGVVETTGSGHTITIQASGDVNFGANGDVIAVDNTVTITADV